MIEVIEIYCIVRVGELTMSEEKCRVARYRLIKKLHRFKKIISLARGVNAAVIEEFFCSQEEIVGSEVRRRALVDCTLFLWRKFGLKLIRNFLGNLALDGEHIGQIAIVFLRPHMRVVAGID